jgi:predicted lipid-binding transport protein (Tim44 family)
MRRTRLVLAVFAALTLALAPGLAEARLGGGGSFGSRGSQTYTPPPMTRTAPSGADPMQRSMTPNAPSPGPGYAAPGGTPAFQQRSGFMPGLMGGLIGAGIGGLLLGHGFFGGGMGLFGFLGLLLQIFLVVIVVRYLIGLFRSRSAPAFAGPNLFSRTSGQPQTGPRPAYGGAAPGGGRPGLTPVAITPDDFKEFERLLQAIQAAGSAQDINALRSMATPEMLSYFAEELSDQTSRGVRNVVSDVRLLQGDLAQAWAEQGRDYATVAMKFSMVDITVDATGRVVDGNPNEHVTATELWTFVRSRGGRWILSAIQQAR